MAVQKTINAITRVFFVAILSVYMAVANADYANAASMEHRAYDQAALAPDGKHFAVISRVGERPSLLIFNIKTGQAVAGLSTEASQDILKFWWANNERVVVNLSMTTAEFPLLTGELYALNVDNSRKFAVGGFSAGDSAEYGFIDPLTSKNKEIWISRSDLRNKNLEPSRPAAYTLDIYKRYRQSTGTNLRNTRLENKYSSPFPSGGFVVDHDGVLRLAYDIDRDGYLKLSQRNYSTDEWDNLDFSAPMADSQLGTNPVLGFDSRNKAVFYLAQTEKGTIGVYRVELNSGESVLMFADDEKSLSREDVILTSDHEVIGVNIEGKGLKFFVDHPELAQLKGLEEAFNGNRIEIVNYARDGQLALVDVKSDGADSGLYLFNAADNSLAMLLPANS